MSLGFPMFGAIMTVQNFLLRFHLKQHGGRQQNCKEYQAQQHLCHLDKIENFIVKLIHCSVLKSQKANMKFINGNE
jgi:hypothetical protein